MGFEASDNGSEQYPAIAQHIRQAIYEVVYGLKDPNHALQDSAAKSARALG
jgi:multiple sugar transport system substrate-binding protein